MCTGSDEIVTTTPRTLRLEYSLPDAALCKVSESHLNGRRSVRVLMQRATIPAVRMTQRSKFANPRAQEYLAWKEATQDLVLIAMREQGIGAFADTVRLKLSAQFHLAPKSATVMRKDRKTHTRVTHPARTIDLSNLVKAVEDAFQEGVLYKDDRCIFAYGPTSKREFGKDWTEVWLEEIG